MEINTTNVYERTQDAILRGKRTIVNEGGTSSSKTFSTIQLLTKIAFDSKIPLLISIVSESFPHLRRGCMRDFMIIMGDLWDDNKWSATLSEYNFGFTKIEFFSADNASKLRGGRRDILFMNEANNNPKEAYDELDVRTRLFTIIDFNPVEEFWAHELQGRPEVEWIHSTYLDALDVVPQTVIDNILSRKDRDPNWWHVYGLGLVGKVEGLVHPKFQQVDVMPAGGREIYGLDFGFAFDPACLVRNRIKDDCLYSEELLYETGLTNPQISARLEGAGVRKHYDVIIADSAEPKSIEELKLMGWDIRPCAKGPDSVRNGIQRVNQYKQYWTKNSLNCIKEQRNYRYEKDKDGKYTDKPIDDWNHGMDTRRYAVSTIPEPKVLQVPVHGKQFNIDFTKLTPMSTLLISIWTEENLSTSAVMALWSATAGKLFVFYEQVFTIPQPEKIISNLSTAIGILSNEEIKTLAPFEIWGNTAFFDEWGGDLASAFMKSNVYIRENANYNEVGAITLLTRIMASNQISINVRCVELLRQVSQWRITGKPEPGHGLARSILSIISTLNESGKIGQVLKPLKEYSKERQKANKRIRDLVEQGSRGRKPENASANGWMSVT